MPILRMKEINGMSDEARSKKLVELRTELSRLKTMVKAGGAVENPTRIRELRKTIARILTVQNQSQAKLEIPSKKEEPAKKAEKKKPSKAEKEKEKTAK